MLMKIRYLFLPFILMNLLSACPGEEKSVVETGSLSVIAIHGDASNLEADGMQYVEFKLQAFNKDGAADDSAIEIKITDGDLNTEADVNFKKELALTPASGIVKFRYFCPKFVRGENEITISNSSVKRTISVICKPPQSVVSIETSLEGCGNLIGAAGDFCAIPISVQAVLGDQSKLLQGGIALTAEIIEVSNIQRGGMESMEGVTKVLTSVSPSGVTGLEDKISFVTGSEGDALGKAVLYVVAPETKLSEYVKIKITADIDGVLKEEILDVQIRPFEDDFIFEIKPEQNSVEADTDLSVVLRVQTGSGDSIETRTRALTGKTVSLLLNKDASLENGLVFLDAPDFILSYNEESKYAETTVKIHLPTLVSGENLGVVTLSGEFVPDSNDPSFSKEAQVEIQVNREGALLFNASIEHDVIYSGTLSDGLVDTTTLTVELKKSGTAKSFPVEASIDVADRSRAFFVDADGLSVSDNGAVVTGLPDNNGIFAVQIQVRMPESDGVPPARGQVRLVIKTIDTEDNNTEHTLSRELRVDRIPILNGVVYLGAEPTSLGVQGSALPSTAILKFQALYDDGTPAAGANAEFALPDSADPSASVVLFGTTDSEGLVQTVLASGSHAGPLTVTAKISKDNITLYADSFSIPVVGGLPNFAQSYLTCETSGVIHIGGATVKCHANLADRFSNQIQQDLAVQFRTEGGNITPFATLNSSRAEATFVSGAPGRASADVRGWSYGALVPNSLSDFSPLQGFQSFFPERCFDGSTYTKCNILAMCTDETDGHNQYYCPLPVDDNEVGCWEEMPSAALYLLLVKESVYAADPAAAQAEAKKITGCNVTFPSATTQTITCNDGFNQTLPLEISGYQYQVNENLKTLINEYRGHVLDCGYPVSCLLGNSSKDGFDFVEGDECPIALGCFDFAGSTMCPHDGLISVMTSVRGEEGFVDANGNGLYDTGEAYIDMPEPFLDKGDNCVFDNYNNSMRLEAVDEVRESDLFSDIDGQGEFGFPDPSTGEMLFTNGAWDSDTEIFMMAHMVTLSSNVPILDVGEYCAPKYAVSNNAYQCSNGQIASCYEVSDKYGVAPGCAPTTLISPVLLANQKYLADHPTLDPSLYNYASYELTYDWRDHNGNCFSPGFESTSTFSVEGALLGGGSVEHEIRGCGIGNHGEGVRNSERPYCQEYPNLGSDRIVSSIHIDCQNTEGTTFSKYSISHSDGVDYSRTVITVCPECGDGYFTTGEECDNSVGVGESGYHERCDQCVIKPLEAPAP